MQKSDSIAKLSEIKETDKAKCCPECESTSFKQAFDGERECKGCGQSWYADVRYRRRASEEAEAADALQAFIYREAE